MEKTCLFVHPTLRRTFWPVQERFVLTSSVELDGIRGQKCNDGCVIIFQTVILQRFRLVTGSKSIHAWIYAQIDLWNSGCCDELVCNSYIEAKGYLGRSPSTQISEQRHRKLSKLVLCGKLREAVRFFDNGIMGDCYYPMKRRPIKRAVRRKPLQRFWKKYPQKKLPPVLLRRFMTKRLFLLPWILWRMWLNWLHENYQGVWGPVVWTRKLYRVGF